MQSYSSIAFSKMYSVNKALITIISYVLFMLKYIIYVSALSCTVMMWNLQK